MILEQAQWFKPDDMHVARAWTDMFKKYKSFQVPAKQLKNKNIKDFSFQSMVDEYKSYEEKYVPSFSVQVDLNIPKLDLPKLQKIDG